MVAHRRKLIHPKGDTELSLKKREISVLVADTFDWKIHIEWNSRKHKSPPWTAAIYFQLQKWDTCSNPGLINAL